MKKEKDIVKYFTFSEISEDGEEYTQHLVKLSAIDCISRTRRVMQMEEPKNLEKEELGIIITLAGGKTINFNYLHDNESYDEAVYVMEKLDVFGEWDANL